MNENIHRAKHHEKTQNTNHEMGKISRIRTIATNPVMDDSLYFQICIARSTGLHITKPFWLQVVLIAA